MPYSEETGVVSTAFTTTPWNEVLEARQTDPERARAALENLCSRYWYRLYAFVRRRGHGPHDAEDLTQSFFAHLLGTGLVLQVQDSLAAGARFYRLQATR